MQFFDARRIVDVLRRWLPVLLVGAVLAAGVAYIVAKAQPKVYEATVLLVIDPGLGTVGGGLDFNELQASWYKAADDARLIDTTSLAQAALTRVGSRLHTALDATQLLGEIKAQAAPQSGIIALTVRSSDPADAALLANALADSFLAYDANSRVAGLSTALATFGAQMRRYAADEAAAAPQVQRLTNLGRPLSRAESAQLETLNLRIALDQGMLAQLQQSSDSIRLRLAGGGSAVGIQQRATPPPAPLTTRAAIYAVLAALLALALLGGIALLLDLLDTRPRSAEEVAALLDLPLAGVISAAPLDAVGREVVASGVASALLDEFREARAGIAASIPAAATGHAAATADIERAAATARGQANGVTPAGQVIAVLSTGGEGTRGVAAGIAAVAARAGSRVVLIDANVRRPALHDLFGLTPSGGLAQVLRAGGDPLTVVRESAVARLGVLPAGAQSAEVVDLLGSARMSEALGVLRAAADLTVLDMSDATGADALALAPLADAAFVAVSLPASTRATLVETARRLRGAHVPLAGVVVTLDQQPRERAALRLAFNRANAQRDALRSAPRNAARSAVHPVAVRRDAARHRDAARSTAETEPSDARALGGD